MNRMQMRVTGAVMWIAVILAIILWNVTFAKAQGKNQTLCYSPTAGGSSCQPVSPTTPYPVTVIGGSVAGATPYHLVAANSNNATVLKATPGNVYSVQVFGIGAAPAYLKFYNKATAPTCASDAVVAQVMIPAASTAANGAGAVASFSVGKAFTAGIAFCVVTGIADSDNTSVAAATFVVNIDYK